MLQSLQRKRKLTFRSIYNLAAYVLLLMLGAWTYMWIAQNKAGYNSKLGSYLS
jgi:hypothetical protein